MAEKFYTEITHFNSPNYTPNAQVAAAFGYTRTIDYITIHWWGDPNLNPSFDGVVAWLCNPRSQVSAHEVSTGTGKKSATLVNYPDAGWHAGNAMGNAKSIGIECDPRCRNEDYAVVSEVIADLWTIYGKKPLRKHSSWSATACPGNYDLARLQREAEAHYARKVAPTPAPTPAVVEKSRVVYNPLVKFKFTRDSRLEKIPTGGAVGDTIYRAGAEVDIAQQLTMSDGSIWYRTAYSSSKELAQGFRAQNVEKVIVAPVQPEWIRNLKDITDLKLSVLPAGGTLVYDLLTFAAVPDTNIPKGTVVDIAKETTVGGKKFYITKWSADRNVATGILASDLGVPAEPPVNDKPEWLENLEDIADKKMWTRSETPVLNVSNGSVSRTLPINTEVFITHATEMVGKDLLVLEGQKEVIETVYLSDTPIANPDDDLKARVDALEALVKALTEAFNKFVEWAKNIGYKG